ncbi:MAG: AbrB/MazE/SpoVT family DNA-binding domain-containing protein [Candidatus Bathyarchaeia archaeon]
MLHVVVKKVDRQGRLVLPREWRERVLKETDEVVLLMSDHSLMIVPHNIDLSRYVNSVEVDVENFADYHALRRELRTKHGGY